MPVSLAARVHAGVESAGPPEGGSPMLGHHPLLQRQLRKNGRRAFATVLESTRTKYTETVGNDAIVSNTRILWKFRVRVEPDGEPAFEADLDVLLPQLWSPSSGTRFPVLYDPDDHGKIVVDDTEEGEQALSDEMDRERVDRRVARMRASGQGAMADRYLQAHEITRHYMDDLPPDPDERERVLAERRAKIGEIMSGGMGAPATPTILVNGMPVQPQPDP